MKIILIRTARLFAAAAFFMCVISPGAASAHAEGDATSEGQTTVTTTASTPVADAYSFTAQKGDSLTRLARRALQLYQQDKKITLSPAAAVYGETMIAQAMGGAYLEIGQHVNIPTALLQSAVDSSGTLTPAQTARWSQYSTNVSFEAVSDIPAEKPAASAEETNDSDPEAGAEVSTEEKPAANKTSPGTYWWFIGAGALVAVYFVLGGPTPKLSRRK